jgi:cell division transport system permease protein
LKRLGVQLLYFGRSALRGLKASPITSAVAVATIGVSLVLVGAFGLLLQNMESLIERFGDDLHITAYLDDGLPEAERGQLAARIETVEGVAEVRFVSPEAALERFREGIGRGGVLLEGLGENPLPASLEISLQPGWRTAEGLRIAVGAMDGLPGIAEIASGQDWVEGYLRAVAMVRGIAIGLGVILALATLLIVANTIRLAILARRDELEILSLVGASRGFVQTPFLLEGVVQGAVGGAVALALLFALFRLVLPGFEFGLELMLGGLAPRFFTFGEAMVLVSGGALLGLIGSASALGGGWRG